MSRKKKDGQFCSFFLDKKTANNLTGISKITKQSKTTIVEQCLQKEAEKYTNENGEIAYTPAIYHPETEPDACIPCLILKRMVVGDDDVPCCKIITSPDNVITVPESTVTDK